MYILMCNVCGMFRSQDENYLCVAANCQRTIFICGFFVFHFHFCCISKMFKNSKVSCAKRIMSEFDGQQKFPKNTVTDVWCLCQVVRKIHYFIIIIIIMDIFSTHGFCIIDKWKTIVKTSTTISGINQCYVFVSRWKSSFYVRCGEHCRWKWECM